jgi:hypothetical protein
MDAGAMSRINIIIGEEGIDSEQILFRVIQPLLAIL